LTLSNGYSAAGSGFIGMTGSTPGSGGAISLVGGNLTLDNCTVENNQAAKSGGGLFDGRVNTLTITNCVFRGNTAGTDGGGLDASGPTITGTTIANNQATDSGGGIAISGGTIANSTIQWEHHDKYRH
jgi:predicted outer membrane repeat protein